MGLDAVVLDDGGVGGQLDRRRTVNLLWHITLLLRRLAVAVVVGHADAGWTVGLADDLDHVCWCAYHLLSETHSHFSYILF